MRVVVHSFLPYNSLRNNEVKCVKYEEICRNNDEISLSLLTVRLKIQFMAKPKNEDHVSCLHFAWCFAGGLYLRELESLEFSPSQSLGKSSKFFQVPEPI